MLLGIIEQISKWSLPLMLLAIPLYGVVKRVDIYSAFVEGAQEGFWICIKLLPYLVAMFVAIGVLRSSGALDVFVRALTPVTARFNVHPDLLPLFLLRPLSGSGALGVTAEILRVHGPDSFVGKLASCVQGSTDTTLYVISVYFGAVGLKRHRRVLLASLLADLSAYIAAVVVCTIAWGGSR